MRRQRGFTLILVLLFIVLLGASVFLSAQQGTEGERSADRARVFAVAREALVAYALAGGANDEPGALPCPDTDGDGVSDGTSCQGGSRYLGRLPHATLDIDPTAIRGSGEIWFVVDHDFADWDPPDRVNTGSAADLQVNGGGGFAAAVILANDPVQGQDASTNAAADHLEGENVDGDAAFASCDSDTCNDSVVGLSKAGVLAPVRQRLLGVVRATLADFFAANGHYPWAAPLGDPDGACGTGTARGTLPAASGDCGSDYLDALPVWVTANNWQRWVYYAVSGPCAPGGAGCSTGAAGLLTLSGDGDRAVVFATVGPPIVSPGKGAMQDRSGAVPHAVEDYLDSTENVDGDDVFDDPDNEGADNDRLRALAAP